MQPIHAGAGNLYSREYFSLVRDALASGGLALQWIGHRPPTQYRLIMRTFLEVFPHATLWFDGNLMVGSEMPLRLDPLVFAAKRRDPRTASALDEIGLHSFDTLCGWYTAGPEEMRRYVGEGPLLTDDRPLLEYHRSLPPERETLDLAGLRGDVTKHLSRAAS
jgi:spermidine synthase